MNEHAQAIVLFGLIQYGETAWTEHGDTIQPEWFTGINRKIFERIRSRFTDGQPVDQFLLAADFPDSDQIDHIMLSFCSAKAMPRYIRELQTAHAKQVEAMVAADLLRGDLDRDAAIEKLRRLQEQADATSNFTIRQALGDFVADLERGIENFDPGLQTGLHDLDQLIGGIHGGSLVIVAGRPAMGKTALAMNIAQHQDKPVLVFSLEMPAGQLMKRFVAAEGVPHDRLRDPRSLTDEDWPKISAAMQKLDGKKIEIIDTGSISISTIEAEARKRHGHEELGLIVVDYLQLVTCRAENRLQEVSEISRRLKALALNLNVPVIVISQLNREVENRAIPIPKLSDLRESGQLEQDADAVLFVHRPEVLDPGSRIGEAELHLKKHRHGPIGKVDATWQGRFQRFRDLAPDYRQEAIA